MSPSHLFMTLKRTTNAVFAINGEADRCSLNLEQVTEMPGSILAMLVPAYLQLHQHQKIRM
jgi:hypothetical protein